MSCVSPQPTPSMSQIFSVVMKQSKVVRLRILCHKYFSRMPQSLLEIRCFAHNAFYRETKIFLFSPRADFHGRQFFHRPWWGGVRSVQSLSRVRLFATPWTATCQASLSITNSQSLPRLMSMELVMPSNHLILCHLLLLPPSIFPSIRVFSKESILRIRWPKVGISASASVLPMNIQD